MQTSPNFAGLFILALLGGGVAAMTGGLLKIADPEGGPTKHTPPSESTLRSISEDSRKSKIL